MVQYEWKTPARQVLKVEIDEAGAMHVALVSPQGMLINVPQLVESHLQHWWRAECVLSGVCELAAIKRGELQHSATRFSPSAPAGISMGFDSLRRHQQNANSMRSIRDIALSRALSAADKAMLGKTDEEVLPAYAVLMAPLQLIHGQPTTQPV